ncbi:MAG: hypothetical protein GY839_14195 [candidate division Zixibacteria bacterium]|nr:hypothetical protein [candidate division Zixibacteria bacterium]
MRNFKVGLMILAISLIYLATATAGEGKAWFDMENCAFCKNLADQPGLMENFAKWEHHNVKNGSLSISEINKDYVDAYKKAMAGMEATAKKAQAGEQLQMCGYCEGFGGLMMKGVQFDEVQSGNTFVSISWSSDSEVVKAIHAHTDRTNDEMKKMEEIEKKKEMKGHEGHGH